MFRQFYADIDELHRRVQALPLYDLVYVPRVIGHVKQLSIVLGMTVDGFDRATEALKSFAKEYYEVTK